ncbi:MAG TPA: hypothetical protein VIC84_11660 [Blastocatellia bacterium]|nr:hypothetical protein [Blastocatellia bacterium]
MKKRIYARAGIPVYWIISLLENRSRFTPSQPARPEKWKILIVSGARTTSRQDHFTNDEIPVVIEGREAGRLAARELLP